MPTHSLTSFEATHVLIRQLTRLWTECLAALLTTKHLYQKNTIDAVSVINQLADRIYDMEKTEFVRQAKLTLDLESLTLRDKPLETVSRSTSGIPILTLVVRNLKLYCRVCKEREAFAPVWSMDLTTLMSEPAIQGGSSRPSPYGSEQLLFFMYQCQACGRSVVSFLVRRKDSALILEGRSPIEEIEVPAVIPKPEQKYYSDAVVAFQSGKHLAGLFFLRTFVEQFARRVTGTKGRLPGGGDELLDRYGSTIPEDLRSRMPSLKDVYDRLSEAVHEAREDSELFESARTQIEEHFDVRRVHKLVETPPAKSESEERR